MQSNKVLKFRKKSEPFVCEGCGVEVKTLNLIGLVELLCDLCKADEEDKAKIKARALAILSDD